MTCPSCQGRGVFRVCYTDDPEPAATCDYALCCCRAGQWLRSDRNAGRATGSPLYLLLAARWDVDPSRFLPAEELLEPAELQARFGGTTPQKPALNLVDVGRTKPRTRL